jgi:hypothetical protein
MSDWINQSWFQSLSPDEQQAIINDQNEDQGQIDYLCERKTNGRPTLEKACSELKEIIKIDFSRFSVNKLIDLKDKLAYFSGMYTLNKGNLANPLVAEVIEYRRRIGLKMLEITSRNKRY